MRGSCDAEIVGAGRNMGKPGTHQNFPSSHPPQSGGLYALNDEHRLVVDHVGLADLLKMRIAFYRIVK